MTNMLSSFPAINHPMPLHRHGGTLDVMSELQVGFSGDDYDLQGSGNINSMPVYHRGTTFGISVTKGAAIFKNSAKLICPNGVDYVASIGDRIVARTDGDGIWSLYVNSSSGVSLANQNLSLTSAQQNQVQRNVGVPAIMRGYIAGLTLSTAGSSATFGIAAGVAADSTNADVMTLASAYTKTTSAWSLGTAGGSLDTGTIGNNTWYHAYLIKRVDTGVVDVLISASASSPTLPTNYTLARRIGSMKTNGFAQWAGFNQVGENFYWATAVQSGAPNTVVTSASLISLAVPPVFGDISALIRGRATSATLNASLLLFSQSEGAPAPDTPIGNVTTYHSQTSYSYAFVPAPISTNSSGQIAAISGTGSVDVYLVTFGWIDRRGRDK
ncbi:hypothetical protein [Tardiphaga sp. 768_D3_N2_1]|uniref:hypothetical protein n=1 Tax=Tardiphaga sp. 768_D3_N2_1 TaxID=3240783 RepID=UPI003F88B0CE